jgi:transcription elongation factor GreA
MTDRIWLTPEAHRRLQSELAALSVPATPGDVDAVRRRAARVREIRELLTRAVVGEDPPNDGIAEPGMVLTIRYDDTTEEETFLLALRDAEQGELEVYSPISPLGTAITGAHKGEQRSYQVPNGTTVRVTLLDAVP